MCSTDKGQQFLLWVLNTIFGKVETELDGDFDREDVVILDGKDDGGIDACFIEGNELYIIQTKYNSSHSPESVSHFIEQMKRLLIENKGASARVNDVLERSIEKDITKIKLFYITNGVERLENTNPDFKDSMFYIEYNALGMHNIVEYISERYAPIPHQIQKKFDIIAEKSFVNRENNTIVAEVSIKEIAKLVWKGKDYLYHSNIRNHLGNNKVNKRIQKTIKETPKDFWFYNNGVTIVCNSFDIDSHFYRNGGAKVTIDTPQIVNGCQTTKTIFNYMYPKNKKIEDFNNIEGTILVKIIKDTNNKRKDITRYTNSQTAVSGKDFYALEEYQLMLKRRFKELGYNYEIQTKAFIDKEYVGNTEYDYLFDDNFTRRKSRKNTITKKMGNKINVNESTQAYVAGFLFRPGKARSKSNYAPGTSLYEKIYNDESSPEDARYFLFPFALMYYYKKTKNKNNNQGRSKCLFFCNVYFKVMLEVFKQMDKIDKDADNFIESLSIVQQKENIDIIDKIIKNQRLNKMLLDIAEDIVIDFFLDGKITEMIGDNLPKFLKAAIESSIEAKEVLKNQINKQLFHKSDVLNDVELKELFEI